MNFDINFDTDFYINAYPKAKLFYYRFGEIGLKYHFLIYSKKLKIYNTTEPDNYIKNKIDSSINIEDAIVPEDNKEIIVPRKKTKCKTKIYLYLKKKNIPLVDKSINSDENITTDINNNIPDQKKKKYINSNKKINPETNNNIHYQKKKKYINSNKKINSEINKIDQELDQNKFIVIRPINGIGNRLRSIISFKILADYLSIPLYIYWGPSNGFDDTKWTDLFDSSTLDFLDIIDEKKWNYYRNLESSIDIDEHISFINDSNRCCNDISLENILTNNSNIYELSQITAVSSIDLKYINNRIIYKYIPDYDNIYSNYFNKLILNKKLQNIINQNLANLPENIVGVHIRQGDFHHMNHIPIYRYYNSYKTQEYFDKLVSDYINQNKYIFICTDTKSFLDRYIKLYGDKIKYFQKQFVDSILNQSKNGQTDAIIELWIMRNLKEINTDELSSFGFHCKIKLETNNLCNIDKTQKVNSNNILEINLDDINCGMHFYGWAMVMKNFKNYLINKNSNLLTIYFNDQLIFNEWLEKLLIWGHDLNDIKLRKKLETFNYKLITFIHNPFLINYNEQKILLKDKTILYDDLNMNSLIMFDKFNDYIKRIKLLFTLTDDHRTKLLKYNVYLKNKIIVIRHPISYYNFEFNTDVLDNSDISILHVGDWLRNIETFLNFKNSNKKIILKNQNLNSKSILFEKIINSDCEIIYSLNNEDYINMLLNSIVLIDLIDATANNLILECIRLNIPIICNKIKPIVEYLGSNYPLYYNSPEELNQYEDITILLSKAKSANNYLKNLDKTIIDIDIFNNLLEYHLSKLSVNNNTFLLTWICSCFKADNYINDYINDFINQINFEQIKLIIINIKNSHTNKDYVNNYLNDIRIKYTNIIVIDYDYDPGLYECWNISVKLTDTKYITNANLDDRHKNNYSLSIINYLESNPSCDIAFCPCYALNEYKSSFIDVELNTTSIWFDSYKIDSILDINDFKNNNPPHACPIWRRDIHNSIGYFDSIYGPNADYEFWLRCLKYKLTITCSSNIPLYYYYIDEFSYERYNTKKLYKDMINKKYFDNLFYS